MLNNPHTIEKNAAIVYNEAVRAVLLEFSAASAVLRQSVKQWYLHTERLGINVKSNRFKN